MLTLQLKNEIKEYCNSLIDEESGGVLINNLGHVEFFPCQNLSYHKKTHYLLSYLDYLRAERFGKIMAQVHSQENDGPSIADNMSSHGHNLYSIIYCWKSENFYIVDPILKTYLDKDFKIGVNDCYSLVREYFKTELDINLGDYKREENWYLSEPNLMRDNFEKEGFIDTKIPESGKLDNFFKHDLLLFGKNPKELYHMGIYQGNNLMLHQPWEGKSVIEDIHHLWRNRLMVKLTHRALILKGI